MSDLKYDHFLICKFGYLTVRRAAARFQGEFSVSLRLNNRRLKNIGVGKQDLISYIRANSYRSSGQKNYSYGRNDNNKAE